MNPIIHGAIGWLLGQRFERRRDRVLITAAALLPDVDGLGILYSEELYARFHHKLMHGAPAAAVISLGIGAAIATKKERPARAFVVGSALACVAFHSHIAADLVGSGPGWPLWYLWPLSDLEWLPSWQWNLASWQNTVIGLAVILACLSMAHFKRRTPVEIFSLRADRRVVETIRARFTRATQAPPASS